MEADKSRRNRILGVLFTGVLMGALDIAIIGPAIPAVREAFGIDESRTVAFEKAKAKADVKKKD